MRALVPCFECARHVRPGETHCPFCGEAVAFVELRAPRRWRNLGRAAILGFAAATMGACGGGGADGGGGDGADDGTGGGEIGGTGGDTEGGGADDGSGSDGLEGGDDEGAPVPAYGVPPEPVEGDEGESAEGEPDHGDVVAMYGVPAPSDD